MIFTLEKYEIDREMDGIDGHFMSYTRKGITPSLSLSPQPCGAIYMLIRDPNK
jgi:hypothetical protein